MQKGILVFLISFLVAFGGGYLFFQAINPTQEAVEKQSPVNQESPSTDATVDNPAATMPVEYESLSTFGCLSCHAVSSLNLTGGATGPDLSDAFLNVPDKHGKTLEEFLKEPTSAVMSTVIQGNPLSDEQRQTVVQILITASEK